MSNLRALTPDHDLRPAWLTSELFPFQSRFVDVDGARVHYVDEGSGPVLLFLHGAPNWSFFYRQFISGLRHDFRCVALDFPGFGLSPADTRYPPTMPALSRVVERFVEILGLRDIILVVGDAGGPIGLGAAARHPEWFAGLVLAGTFGWSLKESPRVSRMLRIVSSPLVGFLQEHFNVLMKYTADTFPMSVDERAAFLGPYVGAAARRSAGALLGDLVGNDAYMNDIEQALHTRLNHLPVLLIWGDKDPVFEFLPRFQDMYPRGARTLVIPGASLSVCRSAGRDHRRNPQLVDRRRGHQIRTKGVLMSIWLAQVILAAVVGVFGRLGLRGPDMYRPLFVLYAPIGRLNLAVFIGLSDRVESAIIHGERRFIGIHRSAGLVTKCRC